MKIHFIRHGESQANIRHEISNRGLRHGLTRKGRLQAHLCAEKLKAVPAVRIYSSPVLRAIETSIILAEQLDLDYEVTDALREYDCGWIEGASDAAAWQAWQDLYDAWKLQKRWEVYLEGGGESFINIRDRFVPFIEGLLRDYGKTQDEVICVSHGGIYSMMLPLVLKNVDDSLIDRLKVDYTAHIVVENKKNGLYCVDWNGHSLPAEEGKIE
jgi:broad specificity phosphatase PhoE